MKYVLLIVAVVVSCNKLHAQNFPGDGNTAVFFLKVNAKGTYLRVDREYDQLAEAPATLDLSPYKTNPQLLLSPGDFIGFEQVGDFAYTSSLPDEAKALTAVFFGFSGFLSPGILSTVQPVFTSPTLHRNLPTDITQDFLVNPGATRFAQVPAGADRILFSPNDSFFSDNTDVDGDFGVYVKLTIKKIKYKIVKSYNLPITDISLGGVESVELLPSHKTCGVQNSFTLSSVRVTFKCFAVNANGLESPSLNCKIRNRVDAKSFATGGHDHDSLFYPRPLGILSINGNEIDNSSYTTIPLDGIIVLFAASAVAGEISLQTSAIGLDENPISVAETIFRVKEPGLVALVDTYPIGIGAVSHPSVGGHGSPILHEKLKKAGKYYLDSFNASDIPEREFRTINSGGASLPWGGLFDINQNWNQPHCSHRQGNEIDFGLSSFNPRWEYQPPKEIENLKKMKKLWAEALGSAGFNFPVAGERPGDDISHWHAVAN